MLLLSIHMVFQSMQSLLKNYLKDRYGFFLNLKYHVKYFFCLGGHHTVNSLFLSEHLIPQFRCFVSNRKQHYFGCNLIYF